MFDIEYTTEKREKSACYEEYEKLRESAKYPAASRLFAPHAEAVALKFVQANEHNRWHGKLAVVTGVCEDSVAFYVAQELAVSARMHVILLGKSASSLARCQVSIETYGKQKGVEVTLYTVKYNLSCFESILNAADNVKDFVGSSSTRNSNMDLLMNLAHVGTDQARLTKDGLEYNTGCNFIGTHLFTRSLLSIFSDNARVVNVSSMGHCLGTNFQPSRLVEFPEQGGAPEGYICGVDHQEDAIDSALLVVDSIEVDEKELSHSALELQEAVQKRGTQVGRSKMALLADTFHLDRLYDNILFFSFHLLPPAHSLLSATPSQAACAALRAALDLELRQGCYLHSDGQPWEVMPPGDNASFGQACYDAAEQVIAKLVPNGSEPTNSKAPYEPPPSLADNKAQDT